MEKVLYERKHTLASRRSIDFGPDLPVEGVLLVGTKVVLQFETNHSQYGHDLCQIYPAYHDGKRCWLKELIWCPAEGHSAQGIVEYTIPYISGVEIFLEQGVFEFPKP